MKTINSLLALTLFFILRGVEAAETPNIIILFADDLGYADLSSYGNPYIRTPNLDNLANEGQRWTDFYVAAPVCSPSRGALMTGQLSVKTGLYGKKLHVMHPGDEHGIPESITTLPEALKAVGYTTGMFGKWHLGDAPQNWPTRHGFDVWYGVPYSNDMDFTGGPSFDEMLELISNGEGEKAAAIFAENVRKFDAPKSEYWNIPLYKSEIDGKQYKDELIERPVQQETFTKRLTEQTIKFIKKNRKKPFFAYVPYSMPHLPLFSSKKFSGKSLRGSYGDAVEEIDWSVGEIKKTLEKYGLEGNTLVFFSSDNGPWQRVSITGAGSAGLLRGSKGTTWEGGSRVPGIFWGPGIVKPGLVSDIGSTLDLYTTILRLAESNVPSNADGVDITNVLKNRKRSPRTELPFWYEGNLVTYRKDNFKVYFYSDGQSKNKLEHPELYDLISDPSEKQNIADMNPELLRELLELAQRHQSVTRVASPIFDQRLSK